MGKQKAINTNQKSINTNNRETTSTMSIKQSHYFLFFLLFVVIWACYNILHPYLDPIILAVILSIVFHPIHLKIEKLVRGKTLAALISCFLLIIVVVLPLIFLTVALIQQGVASFNAIYDWFLQGRYEKLIELPIVIKAMAWFNRVLPDIQHYFPDIRVADFQIDKKILQLTSAIGTFLLNQSGNIVSNITNVIGKFILMLFTFFFLIKDHEQIVKTIFHLVPLSTSYEERIIGNIRSVAKSALLGSLITGISQGIVGGIAFWLAGLPALFWGTVMMFGSLIPIVGTALVWIPAAVYLYLSGEMGWAIFMIVWCTVLVGMIDNIVRPWVMQDSAAMSPLMIFFSILGGIQYFGLIGLLYGPLIFGLAVALLYIYSTEFETFLTYQDKS